VQDFDILFGKRHIHMLHQ